MSGDTQVVEPVAAGLQTAAIPVELAEIPHWVTWKREQRDGKTTKVPYQTDGKRHASTTDPATWGTFDETVEAVTIGGLADGIGFVFTADDPYVGVDLDAGLSEGERDEIVRDLDSYAETSISGAGVHVIVRASLNGHGRNRRGPIEIYEAGRYFVVTGAHLAGTPPTIETRQDELAAVLERFLPAPAPVELLKRQAVVPIDLDDRELLELAFAARNGDAIEALYRGDTSAHGGDDSAADLALCAHLAFWTGRDHARIDSLFRASGLYRPKWDEGRGESTWGAQTIEKAIAGCRDVYEPHTRTNKQATPKPAPAKSYIRTDAGNGEMFAERQSIRLRYVNERRLWLVWRDGRWRADVDGEAERAARLVAREQLLAAFEMESADERRKDAVAWALKSESDSRLGAMLHQASTQTKIKLRADELDVDRHVLACANGVIDLRTGKLRPADPADLISLGTDVAYNPDAACPRWERFLSEIFDGDAELVAWIQRAFGYSATGDTREQVIFVCHGVGRNGKGTLLETEKKVIGSDFAKTAPFDTFARSRGDNNTRNDLARLHRARYVLASESGEGRRLDEAVVKQLTGNDTVACRFLYAEHFEFVARHEPQAARRRRRRSYLGARAADPLQRQLPRPRRQDARGHTHSRAPRDPRVDSPRRDRLARERARNV